MSRDVAVARLKRMMPLHVADRQYHGSQSGMAMAAIKRNETYCHVEGDTIISCTASSTQPLETSVWGKVYRCVVNAGAPVTSRQVSEMLPDVKIGTISTYLGLAAKAGIFKRVDRWTVVAENPSDEIPYLDRS